MVARRHVRLLALTLLIAGCGGTPASPAAESRSPGSSGVAAERIADIAFLVEQLEAIHPNPYLDGGADAFRARVREIEAQAGDLTNAGFLVAVMRLMGARERDGHSGAWAMAQTDDWLHAWPVWLWDFPDGLRVVASQDRAFLGARLVRVGDTAVAEAWRAVEPLVPRDNHSSLRGNLPMYLTLPEVLDELGLRRPGGPGLTFELVDGSTRELTVEPLLIPEFHDWILGVYGTDYPTGLPPDEDGPPHLQRRAEAFWTEVLTRPAGRYVAYNFVASATGDGYRIGQLAFEIERAAADGDPGEPFVFDLRNNPGGDNTTFASLVRAIETMAEARPGRTTIIAGRSTFSAAGNFITDLLTGPQGDNLRLVGEAPGGGLNIYGDVRVVTLPSSGIVVLISRRYHERAPGDDRLAIEPDLPVELTWADYAAGRDPVLEAALTP